MSEDHTHVWKTEYYGIRCQVPGCNLFYPDNGNYFAEPDDYYPNEDFVPEFDEDDEDEEFHSLECTCETCIQNHPEREIYL